MRRTTTLLVTLAIGVSAGIAVEKTVQAQNPPPAYYVAEVKANDTEAMKPYREKVGATIEKYGGRFLARGGKLETIEGSAPNGIAVIIAFKSLADAHRWYESPEYGEIKDIRHKAATSRVYLVEGLPN